MQSAKMNAWLNDKQSDQKFDTAAHELCQNKDVEGLTSLLVAAESYDLPVWHAYQAGLQLSQGLAWDPNNVKHLPSYSRESMAKHLRGLDTFKALWQSDLSRATHKIEFFKRPEVDPKFVCVVSCDSKFFKLYAEELINSFKETATTGDVLHIHIVNPNEVVKKEIRLEKKPNISYSFEVTKTPSPAYYACARFFAARHILDTFLAAHVVIVDFDAAFKGSMTKIFSNAPNQIAGRRIASPKLPWQIWMASFTFLPNDTESRSYLDAFRDTTIPALENSQMEHWYIDQNALTLLVRKFGFEIRNAWASSSDFYFQTKKHMQIKKSLR